jgi:allantoinase
MRTRFLNLRIPTEGNHTEMCELVVDGGRFSDIVPSEHETAVGGEEWVNLGGALVLPGAIDGHVHFDDPGFTHREDFASGSCAAAAGGVTCVVDMPCTSLPPVTDSRALANKLRVIDGKAHVDYMLWGGVSANSMANAGWQERLARIVDDGVAAIKVYTLSGMDSFRELDNSQLREVLERTKKLGIPVGVHAEDPSVVRQLTARIRDRDGEGEHEYAASRPAEAEVAAVSSVVEACRSTGARAHIVHLASGEALDLISAARFEGLPMSAETCPHFLEFTGEDLIRLGSLLKTAPVVKSARDRERLWQGLASGELSFVTTDHAPGQWPEEKNTGSIWTDYGGVPGVELMLPYLYSEGVCTGKISLERLVEITAAEPARFFGIDHRKGALRRGLDADFVVLDEHESWTVRADALHNLNRYTPLEGRQLTGRVRAVYLRGRCVYQRHPDGSEFFAPQGTGEFIRRGLG